MKFESLEGLRALSHLGIVLLHGSLFATSHMPNEGALWDAFYNHTLSKVNIWQGLAVDIFFALSGFLLTYNLITQAIKAPPSIPNFVLKRVGRIFPTLFVFLILTFITVGDYFNKQSVLDKLKGIASILLLVPNYIGLAYLPLPFGTAWSCIVDIHGGTIILVLVKLGRAFGKEIDGGGPTVLAKRMRWIFLIVTILAIIIRGYQFDIKEYNALVAPKYNTYMFMLSPNNYKWIVDRYQRKSFVHCLLNIIHAAFFSYPLLLTRHLPRELGNLRGLKSWTLHGILLYPHSFTLWPICSGWSIGVQFNPCEGMEIRS